MSPVRRAWLEQFLDALANGGPWQWDPVMSSSIDAAVIVEDDTQSIYAMLAEMEGAWATDPEVEGMP